MTEIKGERLLRKLVPAVAFNVESLQTPPYIGITGKVQSGWEIYFNGYAPYLIYRSEFDISGWSKEQLSAFISGAGFQESDRWTINDPELAGPFAPELLTWDIISKSKMSNSALDGAHWIDGSGLFGWNAPGMLDSNYNLEEVFAGRFRQYIPNTNLNNVLHQNTEQLWGAGDATAGHTIYVTRIVSPFLTLKAETAGIIPPMAIIIPAALAEEKDLVYMERLRRSFVLAESRNP